MVGFLIFGIYITQNIGEYTNMKRRRGEYGNKSTELRVKVDRELKSAIETKAINAGVTLGEYIRRLVRENVA